MNITESVVYLLRKTSLTRSEIGRLTPAQFNELMKEVCFQESVEEWHRQYAVASIMAAIYNTIPRKRGQGACKAGDFLSSGIPQRDNKKQDSLEKLAVDKGIKLPTKELRQR